MFKQGSLDYYLGAFVALLASWVVQLENNGALYAAAMAAALVAGAAYAESRRGR